MFGKHGLLKHVPRRMPDFSEKTFTPRKMIPVRLSNSGVTTCLAPKDC